MSAFISRTGSIDQVLRFLQLVAASPAFTTEVQQAIAPPSFGALTFTIRDATGASLPLALADTQPDTGWVSTAFAETQVSEGPRLAAPFPRLFLLAQPGRMQTGSGGEPFRDVDFQGQIYRVDAIFITGQDDGQLAQREALILAQAFEHLIRRNEQLGGLVELIQPIGPPEPGGIHAIKAGLTSAARQRFDVFVLAA